MRGAFPSSQGARRGPRPASLQSSLWTMPASGFLPPVATYFSTKSPMFRGSAYSSSRHVRPLWPRPREPFRFDAEPPVRLAS